MAYAYVISQLAFRTAAEAGDYQDSIYEETGYDAELRRIDTGFNVVTVVEVSDSEEAINVAASLKEFVWEERIPQVVAVTKGGKEVMPLPSDITIATIRETETRKRYEEGAKAKEYRRKFRGSEAFRRSQQRYQQSALGQAAQRVYAQSEKGKTARKAYRQSPKGVAARQAYQERLKLRIREAQALLEEEGEA